MKKLVLVVLAIFSVSLSGLITFWGINLNESLWIKSLYFILAFYLLLLAYKVFTMRNKTKTNLLKEWEQIRKKGAPYIVLKKGVIEWGIPIGITYVTLNKYYDDALFFGMYFVLFLLGGALVGWFYYAGMERDYEEQKESL
ncbi:hypothetical protein LCL95_01460 [Bacillus timonensis]|nr:hypothetical protein [Bacillus timonensis]